MDPRSLLGVGARATRTELRSAHRRLRAALDPAAGGTTGLVHLLDVALDVATTGRSPDRLVLDPHAVLGVPPTASDDDVKAAYRRLARLVHPDRGGTDELFRVVATAHDVLSGAVHTAGRRRTWSPPPRPRPRRPYRAPAPELRHVTPVWRAWRDLAQHVAVLTVAIILPLAAAIAVGWVLTAVVVAVLVGWFSSVLRPTIDSALRAAVVLAGSRVKVAPEVEPERFLEDTCLDAPVGRQREDELYDAYVRWCRTRGAAVAPWVFVERLRSLGLLYVRSSAWDGGIWVGVTLRPVA
jgi:hypothetical protein